MRPVSFVGSVLAIGTVCLAPAMAQTGRFDGSWSVAVGTHRGTCNRAFRFSIIVENGRARYGGQEGVEVAGLVRPNGAISGTIQHGRDRAAVSGQLSGRFARGRWMTRNCSGTWNAARRG